MEQRGDRRVASVAVGRRSISETERILENLRLEQREMGKAQLSCIDRLCLLAGYQLTIVLLLEVSGMHELNWL